MMRLAMPLFLSACTLAVPVAVATAQVPDNATWARYTAQNQAFSVELPCSADAVAEQSPRVAHERRADPAATVGCLYEGRAFTVTWSTLAEATQPGRPVFDVLRDATMGRSANGGPAISESVLGTRRMLVSRQVSGGTIGQVHVVEISDRSWLTMIAGGPLTNTVSSLTTQQQMERFFASIEIAS